MNSRLVHMINFVYRNQFSNLNEDTFLTNSSLYMTSIGQLQMHSSDMNTGLFLAVQRLHALPMKVHSCTH